MKRLFKRILTTIGLATAASCATTSAPVPVASPRPALWQVSDKDTTVYLFGTIHLLPKDSRWQTPALASAIGKSQGLYLETIIDEANPAELAQVMASLGFAQGLPPILDRVPAAKRPLLEAAIAKSGVPRAAFDRMETWAAAFTQRGIQFRSIGLEGGEGVETNLKTANRGAGKPVGQLETNREQLGFFDTLPETAQRTLLEGSIDAPGDMRVHFQGMLEAWLRGDVASIAKTFNEDLSGSPELMDALIRRRNENWTNWITQRMRQPGTIMIAVGAGHLAGNGSVQQYLQKRGLKVKRVQ
jgi:uncharacterized protein YbaP (TraB family)